MARRRPIPSRPATAAVLVVTFVLVGCATAPSRAPDDYPEPTVVSRPPNESATLDCLACGDAKRQKVEAGELDARRGVGDWRDAMNGRFAGVDVVEVGGGLRVRMRGLVTINGSTTAPLIVLDNMPLDESADGVIGVSLRDVKSIRVLRDPSQLAQYGARAANGVIVVTTRSQ